MISSNTKWKKNRRKRKAILIAGLIVVIIAAIAGYNFYLDSQQVPQVPADLTVPVGGRIPWGVAVNPNTNMIYVAISGSGTVSVIDSTTNSLVESITVGDEPDSIAVNPNNSMIYVTYWSNVGTISRDDTVSVIDGATNSLVQNITVGYGRQQIAVNPNTNMIYVTNSADNTLSIISHRSGPPSGWW